MLDMQARLNQKIAQLAAVREISQAIAEAQDLNDTLDLITRRTTEVMHVDSCSIYLYDDSNEFLELAASTGLRGKVELPYGAGLTGWAAEHRQTATVSDAFSDARFYRVIGSGESRFPSLMAMPLVSHDKVIGAANVQMATRHVFTEDQIELFGFITELAAIAIEKARLVHTAIVQEMHHRVKNNLQTVAMLLRLQMNHPELSPHDILRETVNRILSIATVHELLSEVGADDVGALELIKRLVTVISSNMVNPTAAINIDVTGENIQLTSQKATNIALITSELLQNALEHGIAERPEGQIQVSLHQIDDQLLLTIRDDGHGLPADFNLDTDLGLGLDIVYASVTEDMSGSFEMSSDPNGIGTMVTVSVPLRRE
ncbi:GAF domain-containing protein [Anaerolineales bacterium HSG24]|nr:GAF domain-containing protein [Anaerolineales bacterium HSG24]